MKLSLSALFFSFLIALVSTPVVQASDESEALIADLNSYFDGVFADVLKELDPQGKDIAQFGIKADPKSSFEQPKLSIEGSMTLNKFAWSGSSLLEPKVEKTKLIAKANVSGEAPKDGKVLLSAAAGLTLETDVIGLFRYSAENFDAQWCSEEALANVPKSRIEVTEVACAIVKDIAKVENVEELADVLDGPLKNLKVLLSALASEDPETTIKYDFKKEGKGEATKLTISAAFEDLKDSELRGIETALAVESKQTSWTLEASLLLNEQDVDYARQELISGLENEIYKSDREGLVKELVRFGGRIKEVVVDGKGEGYLLPWWFLNL